MHSKILTNWQPSALDAQTIRREFPQLLATLGFELQRKHDLKIRNPKSQQVLVRRNDEALEWHRDGNASGEFCVMWSNRSSTEVRGLSPKDGDVILAVGLPEHRMPRDVEGRWFVRAANLQN